MDDMKKLVEKYKRELMEYSRAASPAPEKLSFPEMLPDEPAAPPEIKPAEQPEKMSDESQPLQNSAPENEPEPRKPRIVGYSDDKDKLNSLEKYITELQNQTAVQPESPPVSAEPAEPSKPAESEQPAYNELPPQFNDAAPQNDFTGSAVSPETNFVTEQTEPLEPEQFPRSGEVTAAEPGTVENIGEIPESGTSPDEQLGRRSFESQQQPTNSREDIKPLVQTENPKFPKYPPEPEYADMNEFLKANNRMGSLRFRTYTARNALPVPNAVIEVFKTIGGKKHTFYRLTTDISGQTEQVTLPAPSSTLSQTPDSGVQPYSLYDADIAAEGYIPVSIRNLPIFEGILSVQRAAMVPSTGKSAGETITEQEPDLTEVPDA